MAETQDCHQPTSRILSSLRVNSVQLVMTRNGGPSYFGNSLPWVYILLIRQALKPPIDAIPDMRLVDANASANQNGYR